MIITGYNMSRVDAMEGHEFEHFIASLLRQLEYKKVVVTPGSGDQGVDILAEKDDIRYAIQCKCYSNDLGNTPVQEVNTGKMLYQCHVGVVVTNRFFTQSAKEAAKATGVLLWDRKKLEKLIAQIQAASEVDSFSQQSEDSFILWSGSSLLKRGGIALKDMEWKKAIQCFERALNTDPENAEAYLGLAMANMKMSDEDEFMWNYVNNLTWQVDKTNLKHMKEFAGPELNMWFTRTELQLREEREQKLKEAVIRLRPIRESLKKVPSLIAVGKDHVVGLKSDGTVEVERNSRLKYDWDWEWDRWDVVKHDISEWKDIIAIACGSDYTIGLKLDGTVVATGGNECGQCHVFDWRDIVTVTCSNRHTVGS